MVPILSVEEATRQWLRREYFKAALTGLLANEDVITRNEPGVVRLAWRYADEAVKQENV